MTSTEIQQNRRGQIMMIVGLMALLAAAGWLWMVADPFPMWLILAGGGLLFLGVGASLNRAGG
jgi:hypothetical protein